MATLKRQRGLSMSGFLLGSFFLILIMITSFKMIPAYMENATIQGLFAAVASDPEMQEASLRDIRNSYIKRSLIENITAIHPDDVEIEEDDDGTLILSASYIAKIHLAGNVSLYMEFNPSSETN